MIALLLAITAVPNNIMPAASIKDTTKINPIHQNSKITEPLLPMPMNYSTWSKMTPAMKQAYAAVTIDGLKWSYLFNDCTPLTTNKMVKGIEAGRRQDPVMIAVASIAYATCQN